MNFAEPLALLDLPERAALVHHHEELAQVGLGVLHHLLVGQHGAGGRLAAGVAYLRRPVADDEDYLVAEVLQLAQLAEANQYGRGGCLDGWGRSPS